MGVALHTKARGPHPGYPARTVVGDKQVKWSESFVSYKPANFTHATVRAGPAWADKLNVNVSSRVTFSRARRGMTLRKAGFMHKNKPRNPRGRTGMTGRGLLGKWGPNQAADAIVTRFSPANGCLQFVFIKRRDTGETALPGGMTEGKPVAETTLTEFKEEALRADKNNKVDAAFIAKLDTYFGNSANSRKVFVGYVDDPRNTDNAWMETHASHFHIPRAETALVNMPLLGGDDASKAMWVDYSPSLELYASHKIWVDAVAARLLAPKPHTRSSQAA